jgi:hypothetical protein
MLIDVAENPESIDLTEARQVLQKGFEQLPDRDRNRILDMARKSEEHLLEDIIETNNFGVFLRDEEHAGLYPETAVGYRKDG